MKGKILFLGLAMLCGCNGPTEYEKSRDQAQQRSLDAMVVLTKDNRDETKAVRREMREGFRTSDQNNGTRYNQLMDFLHSAPPRRGAGVGGSATPVGADDDPHITTRVILHRQRAEELKAEQAEVEAQLELEKARAALDKHRTLDLEVLIREESGEIKGTLGRIEKKAEEANEKADRAIEENKSTKRSLQQHMNRMAKQRFEEGRKEDAFRTETRTTLRKLSDSADSTGAAVVRVEQKIVKVEDAVLTCLCDKRDEVDIDLDVDIELNYSETRTTVSEIKRTCPQAVTYQYYYTYVPTVGTVWYYPWYDPRYRRWYCYYGW